MIVETKRKGARTIKDIPESILEQLNRGEIETANLVEFLAIDQKILLENLLTQCKKKEYLQPVLEQIDKLKKQTVNTVSEAIGIGLLEQATAHKDKDLLQTVSMHKSDLVRCWATFAVGKNTELNIEQMLHKIKPFAADKHFSTREDAWIAVGKAIILGQTHEI